MIEKKKFNPLFPRLIMAAGGRPTYFKMGKFSFLHAIVGRFDILVTEI
jgi:hypothetical protein